MYNLFLLNVRFHQVNNMLFELSEIYLFINYRKTTLFVIQTTINVFSKIIQLRSESKCCFQMSGLFPTLYNSSKCSSFGQDNQVKKYFFDFPQNDLDIFFV